MKRRFIAKMVNPSDPRKSAHVWGVYDLETASWPVHRSFGTVKQNMKTEAEAQTEADRVEGLVK